MTDSPNYFDDLKKMRDELKLQMHLASMDAKDEWTKLEKKWEKFAADAELEETARGVGQATEAVAAEMRKAYERLKKAL